MKVYAYYTYYFLPLHVILATFVKHEQFSFLCFSIHHLRDNNTNSSNFQAICRI